MPAQPDQQRDSPFDSAYSPDGQRVEVFAYLAGLKLALLLDDVFTLDAPWKGSRCVYIRIDFAPVEGAAGAKCVTEGDESPRTPHAVMETFDQAAARVASEFRAWLDSTLPVPESYAAAGVTDARYKWGSGARTQLWHAISERNRQQCPETPVFTCSVAFRKGGD